MNKPVWVLLPFAPDWRWHAGAHGQSRGIPLCRLFRQKTAGGIGIQSFRQVTDVPGGRIVKRIEHRSGHGKNKKTSKRVWLTFPTRTEVEQPIIWQMKPHLSRCQFRHPPGQRAKRDWHTWRCCLFRASRTRFQGRPIQFCAHVWCPRLSRLRRVFVEG